MLMLVVDAAVLGLIIMVMEQDDFPGWIRAVVCALATSLVTSFATAGLLAALEPSLSSGMAAVVSLLLGALAGAGIGAVAISALCGMTIQRAALAAGIFLGYRIALSFLCVGLLRTAGT